MKKVLIFRGGWEGHDPVRVSDRFAAMMREDGCMVDVFDTLDCLADAAKVASYDLIIPCWTMGSISDDHVQNVSMAVAAGTGLAGCHGGMCDAFRQNTDWQFMTGGQWVAHPGDTVRYTVNIHRGANAITAGIDDFEVCSEQYYLHVDPAIEVLATTRFPCPAADPSAPYTANRPIDMPVVWTKFWGKGRIFYCSLGHDLTVFDNVPQAQLLMRRGMHWAAQTAEGASDR